MGNALREDADTASAGEALGTMQATAQTKYAVVLTSDLEDKLIGWGFDLDSAVRFAQLVTLGKSSRSKDTYGFPWRPLGTRCGLGEAKGESFVTTRPEGA